MHVSPFYEYIKIDAASIANELANTSDQRCK